MDITAPASAASTTATADAGSSPPRHSLLGTEPAPSKQPVVVACDIAKELAALTHPAQAAAPAIPPAVWLQGGGEMGEAVRAYNWATTPLGPIDAWPQSLRTAAAICLSSTAPASLVWGQGLVQIYNDGYRQICGARHAEVLGSNFRTCWQSVWSDVGHLFERALAGESCHREAQRIFLDRNGFLEEAYFTYSFIPVRAEDGQVAGVYHPVTEVTEKMLSERRIRALRDVMMCNVRARSPRQAIALAIGALSSYAEEIPFAVVYDFDPHAPAAHAAQVACVGPVPQGLFRTHVNLPSRPSAETPGDAMPADVLSNLLNEVRTTRRRVCVDNPALRFGPLPAGQPYQEAPRGVVALPLQRPAPNEDGTPQFHPRHHDDEPRAVLIVGTSARLPLLDPYLAFLDVLATMVAVSMGEARRREADAAAQSGSLAAEIPSPPSDQTTPEHATWISDEVRVFEALLQSASDQLIAGRRVDSPSAQAAVPAKSPGDVHAHFPSDAPGTSSGTVPTHRALELEGRIRLRTAALALVARRLDAEMLERKQSQHRAQWLASFPQCDPDPEVELDVCGNGTVIYANPAARALREFDTLGARHPLLHGLVDQARDTWLCGRDGPLVREVSVEDRTYSQRLIFVPESRHLRVYCRDISKLKLTEQALRASEASYRELSTMLENRVVERTQRLEEAVGELEAFTYTVSHDLRAPLRSITGFARAAVEDFSDTLPAECRRFLSTILRGSMRMGALIDDLLRFSYLGRQELCFRDVEMDAMVREVVEEEKAAALGIRSPADSEAKPHSLEVRVACRLPPCKGDAALLRQVWSNLISNAIKYSRNRTHAVVEIGAQCDSATPDEPCVYYVRDNGAGFPMRHVNRLFGVFQRLHNHEEYEGTGVGLAIVRRVIHRHGGHIWANSAPDKGAEFSFVVTRRKSQERRARLTSPSPPDADSSATSLR
ncbi:hypothetical protein DB346_21490 [Verrucomicrobia bacterium LW23]|nr:hypothetical protein DB346_21490 [Verrucomicrobia bacterium LW23]